MGLPCELFEFSPPGPTYSEIYERICKVHGAEIPKTIHRDRELPLLQISAEERKRVDEVLAKWRERNPHRPKPVRRKTPRIRLASESITLEGKPWLWCGTYLDICASADGDKIFIMGNSPELFESACAALDGLGGVKKTSATK